MAENANRFFISLRSASFHSEWQALSHGVIPYKDSVILNEVKNPFEKTKNTKPTLPNNKLPHPNGIFMFPNNKLLHPSGKLTFLNHFLSCTMKIRN